MGSKKNLTRNRNRKAGGYTIALYCLLLWTAAGHAQGESTSEIEKIRQIRNQTNEALHRFDIHRETVHYTEDYTIATSSGIKITGKQEYIRRYQNDNSGVYTRTPGEIRIGVNDTVAYETGRWEARQPKRRFGGSYTAQWLKRDNTWKVQSEIYILLWVDE